MSCAAVRTTMTARCTGMHAYTRCLRQGVGGDAPAHPEATHNPAVPVAPTRFFVLRLFCTIPLYESECVQWVKVTPESPTKFKVRDKQTVFS
jgi:hypothetical protein